jgi:mannose-6-phosphate isomerase-like protein (cupin superfamily)
VAEGVPTRLALDEVVKRLPTAEGQRFTVVLERGLLSLELYAPRGTDPQKPHTRDELYLVAAGNGVFRRGDEAVRFGTGDCLYAAAGEVHRFEDFSDDLAVWVVFWGPEGGHS